MDLLPILGMVLAVGALLTLILVPLLCDPGFKLKKDDHEA